MSNGPYIETVPMSKAVQSLPAQLARMMESPPSPPEEGEAKRREPKVVKLKILPRKVWKREPRSE